MEPELFTTLYPLDQYEMIWVCLEMGLEGIKCGYAVMQPVPWGYLFQGWLL